MARLKVSTGRPYESPSSSKERRGVLRWSSEKPRHASQKTSMPLVKTSGKKSRLVGVGRSQPGVERLAVGELSFLSLKNFLVLMALASITVLLVLGLVRSNHQAVSYSYEISGLTGIRLNALEKNRQLKMEMAQMTSLDQLEKVAKETLGLVVPQKGQIVVID